MNLKIKLILSVATLAFGWHFGRRHVRLGATGAASVAKMTVLQGGNQEVNSMAAPQKILPVESKLEGVSPSFSHDFPPRSLTVLRFALSK